MCFGEKKPVTIITGYLGAGKTTVLNELLRQKHSERFAVVVNDMGRINIDASLIRSSSVYESDISVVELTNGCICCTLRDTFMKQINEIASQYKVSRILVEASGISDPSAIAAAFMEYQRTGLCDRVFLDSIVCVVDAERIYSEFLSDLEKPSDASYEQDPDIINLIIDQIEFCNIILLNKCDLLPLNTVERVRETIHAFQKDAILYECIQGQINPDKIFNNGKFDYEKVLLSSRVQSQLAAGKNESIHDAHGITSFLYEEKRPFDRAKFAAFVENDYPENIIRAKGYIWFADDDMHVQLFEQAGRNASVTEASNWVAAFPEKEQKKILKKHPHIMDAWDARFGDRLNQIVFIGKNFDPHQIITELQACVCNELPKEKKLAAGGGLNYPR